MKEFSWKIQEVNSAAGTMVVEYNWNDQIICLNIPMPGFGENLGDWVKMYAPVMDWDRAEQIFADVQEGMHGKSVIEDVVPSDTSETPNIMGSWNEEYLRAMIYQILEEIQDSQV